MGLHKVVAVKKIREKDNNNYIAATTFTKDKEKPIILNSGG
jgi:hypothetical protein